MQGGNPLGFLRWQELSPFIIQTDWDATSGGINNGERIRISSIGSNGVPKPANFIDDNVTRVAISHRGNSPITAPRSLLHLGYNTGNGLPLVVDGWRDWMDIGTFTNNGTDNIYVGLKEEGPDRFDAVINWGDNQVAGNTPIGPDNLRFIFTSTTTALPPGQGDPVSMSNNGLETARMVPTKASTLPASNFGMMGIGDWTTAFNINNPIDAKLDIDGDLRIRTVTEDTTLLQVLVINFTDHNRVHWRSVDDLGSDDQNLTGATLNGALLQIDIENGNSASVDLSSINTDAQTLSFNGSGELCISNGNCVPLPPGSGGGAVTANNGLRIFPANSGNVQLGQANTGGTALTGGELLDNREIPLNGHSLFFSTNGRIGIGTFSSSKLTVKNDLDLDNILLLKDEAGTNKVVVTDQGLTTVNSLGSAALAVNLTTPSTGSNIVNIKALTTIDANFPGSNVTGIESSFTTGGGDLSGRTVRGISSNPRNSLGSNIAYHTNLAFSTTGENIGLSANVTQGNKNYGALLNAQSGIMENYGVKITAGTLGSNPNQNNAINYGVNATVTGGNTTYGGRFSATGGSNKNYGIYVTVSGPPSGTTPPSGPNYAGYFAGDVYISGTFGGPSDLMLKDNLNEINNASNIINQLQPKTFDYKLSDFPNMNLSSGLQYGLIAQDVEAILPDLITEVTQPAELDSLGNVVTPEINFKGLEYQQLIPILIAGFKEQQSELDTKDSLIDNLQSEINYIKECLLNARICEEGNRTINQNPTTETNQKSIELINTNSIILDQNLPNPFAETTVINYNIPTDVLEAKLLFYDLNGRIIKELMIEERGESKLTVYGNNLKTGVYTYSLIADGELIATKKMIKK